jgi:hypothetical protein
MKIHINMNKAREIHRENLRRARAPKFAELDQEFQRELEKGQQANTQAIVAAKQRLRDTTADPRIDAATTPEALKAAWPTDLLGDSPYGRRGQR